MELQEERRVRMEEDKKKNRKGELKGIYKEIWINIVGEERQDAWKYLLKSELATNGCILSQSSPC